MREHPIDFIDFANLHCLKIKIEWIPQYTQVLYDENPYPQEGHWQCVIELKKPGELGYFTNYDRSYAGNSITATGAMKHCLSRIRGKRLYFDSGKIFVQIPEEFLYSVPI